MAGWGGLYGLSAFNDLIHGCTLLYITSCPAAPRSLSLSFFSEPTLSLVVAEYVRTYVLYSY
jgi:hypothetical protein